MRQFLLIIAFLTSLVFANLALAETSGPHISVERIQLDDTTTLPAGVEVNFLGVIDVKPSVAESGKLATFTYGDRIYNADAAFFTEPREMQHLGLLLRSLMQKPASICTALIHKSLDSPNSRRHLRKIF